jgi:hypothetical protein
VKIEIEQSDTTLRPGMTTGNAIITSRTDSALFISLEALNSENGIPYVYKKSGGGVTRQEVETGAMNDDAVIITRGLEQGDRVLLVPPADGARLELVRLPNSKADLPKAGGDTAPSTRLDSVPAPAQTQPPAAAPARPRS